MGWKERNKALKAEMLAGREAGQTFGMSEGDKENLRAEYKDISAGDRDRMRRSHQSLLKSIKNTGWNRSNNLARLRGRLTHYERLEFAGVFSQQGRGMNPVTGGVIPYRHPNSFERALTGGLEGIIGTVFVDPFRSLEGTTGVIGMGLTGPNPVGLGFNALGGAWRNTTLRTPEGIPYTTGGFKPRPQGGWLPGGNGEKPLTTGRRVGEALLPLLPAILKGGGDTPEAPGTPGDTPPTSLPFIPSPGLPPSLGMSFGSNNDPDPAQRSVISQTAIEHGNAENNYQQSQGNFGIIAGAEPTAVAPRMGAVQGNAPAQTA
jgi:hypothetical protein